MRIDHVQYSSTAIVAQTVTWSELFFLLSYGLTLVVSTRQIQSYGYVHFQYGLALCARRTRSWIADLAWFKNPLTD
jgi:hypothetical protein